MVIDNGCVIDIDKTDIIEGVLTFPAGAKMLGSKSQILEVCNERGELTRYLDGKKYICRNLQEENTVKRFTPFLPEIKEINFSGIENIALPIARIAPRIQTVHGENILSICDCCFEDCEKLKAIDLSNANTIGKYAFAGAGLEIVLFGTSIKNIDFGAFSYTMLESVNIQNAKIATHAFRGCDCLQTVYMNSTDLCETWSFYQCEAINEIYVKEYNVSNIPYIDSGYEYSICECNGNGTMHNIICGDDEVSEEIVYEYVQKMKCQGVDGNLYILKDGRIIHIYQYETYDGIENKVSPEFSSIDEFKDYMDMEGS